MALIRLEKLIFYVFLFSIPFQTRLIVWRWTQPFNEWTAGFIYATDVLIVSLLVLWLVRIIKHPKSFDPMTYHRLGRAGLLLAVFFGVSMLSAFNSKIVGLSFYKLVKLAEFVLLYYYLRSNIGGVFNFRLAAAAIAASGFFQSIIAIGQYLKQGSLGLKIFGESPVGADIPNVAVFIADGQKYLRAYGATPHPNVLAAWLLLAIFAFYFLHLAVARGVIGRFFYGIVLFGFFFTFSRVIIGLWALSAVTAFLLAGQLRKRLGPLIATTLVVSAVFTLAFWPQVRSRLLVSFDEEAVTQRAFYNRAASSITRANPFLGIGIGQFAPTLMSQLKHYPAYFYQPVHNIYLLIASETGLVGLGVFLAFLLNLFWGAIKKSAADRLPTFSFLFLPFAFLAIGIFDHFLWTSQQGSLILWLIFALISSKSAAVDKGLLV